MNKNDTIFEVRLGHLFNDKNYPLFLFDTSIKGHVEKNNWHSNIEIFFILSGECEILYDSQYLPVKENEFCVINSNVIHNLRSENGVEILNFGISSEFCYMCGIDIEHFIFDRIFQDQRLRKKLSVLTTTYFKKKEDNLYDAKLSMDLLDFCIHLVSHHTIGHTNDSFTDPIHLALGYIKSRYNEKITLDDIANQVGLSKYHLSRKFKEVTGYTISHYINELRCQQACIYFRTTTLSIEEVYNKLYFCSYDYFLKVFKKTVGCTISQYIDLIKKEKK